MEVNCNKPSGALSYLFCELEREFGHIDRALIDIVSKIMTISVHYTKGKQLVNRDQTTVVISGSMGEKWCPLGLIANDVDSLYLMPGMVADTKERFIEEQERRQVMGQGGPIWGFLKQGSYPGFYKMVDIIRNHEEVTVPSNHLLQTWSGEIGYEPLEPHQKHLHMFMYSNTHGPAVWMDEEAKPSVSVSQPWVGKEVDAVPCLRVRAWPREDLEAFFKRARPAGWPSQTTLDIIEGKSCFLVPVGPAGSGDRDVEWRLSSTLAEFELVRALSDLQRLSFCLFKSLLKTAFEGQEPPFCTYHLKTLLFYNAEKYGIDHWQETNVMQCVQELMEKLTEALTTKHCPNFFISSHNMFRHLDVSKIDEALQVITDIDLSIRALEEQVLKTPFVHSLCSALNVALENIGTLCKDNCWPAQGEDRHQYVRDYCTEIMFGAVNHLSQVVGGTEDARNAGEDLKRLLLETPHKELKELYEERVLKCFRVFK